MEKKTKKASGGKRSNAGRKPQPEADKRRTMFIYPKGIEIDTIGKDELKAILEKHTTKVYNKIIASKTL